MNYRVGTISALVLLVTFTANVGAYSQVLKNLFDKSAEIKGLADQMGAQFTVEGKNTSKLLENKAVAVTAGVAGLFTLMYLAYALFETRACLEETRVWVNMAMMAIGLPDGQRKSDILHEIRGKKWSAQILTGAKNVIDEHGRPAIEYTYSTFSGTPVIKEQ